LKTNVIYNEDCLEKMKELPDNSVDLVLTDPPYNVSVDERSISRKNMSSGMMRRAKDINFDFGDWDIFEDDNDFLKFTEQWFSEVVRVMREGAWIYTFFDKQKTGYFDLYLAPKYEIKPRLIFIWLKSNPVPSFRKTNWLSATEHCWVGSKGKSKIKNFKYQKEMLNYFKTANKSIYGETEHPTEKPLSLISKLIEVNSNEGDVVLDPFIGSGTTALACLKNDRKFIGFERDENYYKMSLKRIGKFDKSYYNQLSEEDRPKQQQLI